MENNPQKNSSVLDFLVILLLGISLGSWLINRNHTDCYVFIQQCLIWFIYIVLRLLNKITNHFEKFIVICVSMACLFESSLGLLQLLRFLRSDFLIYPCLGTFNNPGPYAGFLVTCMSIMIAYLLKGDGNDKLVRVFVIIGLLVSVVVLPIPMSRSSFLALFVGLLFLLISIPRLKEVIWKYRLYIFVLILLSSIGLYFIKEKSANGRMHMNVVSARIIKDSGFWGKGLGSYSVAFGKEQANYFSDFIKETSEGIDFSSIPEWERNVADSTNYAFNDYFQKGVEAGLCYMFLFIAFIILTIVESYKKGIVWCYGIISFSVFALFSYPLECWENVILFPLIVALANRNRRSVTVTILYSSIFIMSLLLYVKVLSPQIKIRKEASNTIKQLNEWYNLNQFSQIVDQCSQLDVGEYNDDFFYFLYGDALQKSNVFDKSIEIFLKGMNYSSNPELWNAAGSVYMHLKEYDKAEQCFKYAFCMIPNRLTPLYNLMKLYYTEGKVVKFKGMYNKIQHFNPKVESEITRQMRQEIERLNEELDINF